MVANAAETVGGGSVSFWATPEFWVLVAFVLLVALVGQKIVRVISAGLDSRADNIRARIEEAEKLRDEAQELLASYQRKQHDATKEAEEIVERAREEAARLAERAADDLERSLKRREQLAMDRIAQAETSAVDQVRSLAVDVALEATRRVLTDNLPEDKADGLVDAAIKELPEKLH
ncbi:MAG: F0F1 ATP synthase subunit B [Rhodospirillales bacterium]|nr:F0F1 ATP synthase subunit B [Rhodospirillales bacterium]